MTSSSQTIEQESGGAAQAHEGTVHGEGHAHPSDRNYVVIALILAVITAVEVAFFYVEEDLGSFVVPGLLIMMVLKFFIVAAWFMHLRFDSKLFTRLFLAGLVLATAVYAGTLASFRFWSPEGELPNEPEAQDESTGTGVEE